MMRSNAATRCMVITDYPLKMMTYQRLMISQGFEFELASTLEEAESAYKEFSPDLILVDMNVQHAEESALMRRVTHSFESPSLMLMQEDSRSIRYCFRGCREMCFAGKWLSIPMIAALLNEMSEEIKRKRQLVESDASKRQHGFVEPAPNEAAFQHTAFSSAA